MTTIRTTRRPKTDRDPDPVVWQGTGTGDFACRSCGDEIRRGRRCLNCPDGGVFCGLCAERHVHDAQVPPGRPLDAVGRRAPKAGKRATCHAFLTDEQKRFALDRSRALGLSFSAYVQKLIEADARAAGKEV